jgi:hypothetical protein
MWERLVLFAAGGCIKQTLLITIFFISLRGASFFDLLLGIGWHIL